MVHYESKSGSVRLAGINDAAIPENAPSAPIEGSILYSEGRSLRLNIYPSDPQDGLWRELVLGGTQGSNVMTIGATTQPARKQVEITADFGGGRSQLLVYEALFEAYIGVSGCFAADLMKRTGETDIAGFCAIS